MTSSGRRIVGSPRRTDNRPREEAVTGPSRNCTCRRTHRSRRVVLTGGPGAGKTAVLELVRASMCSHVRVLPEAASILFSGGFPRQDGLHQRRAVQRAIFQVQRELEAVGEADAAGMLVCDRGTLDGLAYWPGDPDDLWASVHSDLRTELHRYTAVIHLRTPSPAEGYNHANPWRTETAEDAARIDARIAEIWADHPRVFTVPATEQFLTKAHAALDIFRSQLPPCCRHDAELAGTSTG
jgi:predicted ATPase